MDNLGGVILENKKYKTIFSDFLRAVRFSPQKSSKKFCIFYFLKLPSQERPTCTLPFTCRILDTLLAK